MCNVQCYLDEVARGRDPSCLLTCLRSWPQLCTALLDAGARITAKDAINQTPVSNPAAHPDLVAFCKGYKPPRQRTSSIVTIAGNKVIPGLDPQVMCLA